MQGGVFSSRKRFFQSEDVHACTGTHKHKKKDIPVLTAGFILKTFVRIKWPLEKTGLHPVSTGVKK